MSARVILARRVCLLLLVLAIVLGVAACGANSPAGPGGSPAPTNTSGGY